MRNWKYKVEKMMKGMQGKWLGFGTAATFATEAEARAYAADFAENQRAAGVRTARFVVRSRRKTDGSDYVGEVRI